MLDVDICKPIYKQRVGRVGLTGDAHVTLVVTLVSPLFSTEPTCLFLVVVGNHSFHVIVNTMVK